MTIILDDTIAAIASAPGGALRGIVRISGPDVIDVVERCLRLPIGLNLRELRQSKVVSANLELDDCIRGLPCSLYLWPTERSYTRQPTAELHTLGSPPLLEAVLKRVCQLGTRLARPGEFTLRAFLAGRIDLPQAEAVLGIIDAASERELSNALRQMAGGLSDTLNQLRNELLDALADLEAGLDFVEDDIAFITNEELTRRLESTQRTVRDLRQQMSVRDVAAREPRVVLMGAPNVGKSSLLNALVRDSAAIVADCPGTTRDYVENRVTFDSFTCTLIDTAGLGNISPLDPISRAAREAAHQQQRDAHLQLFCIDASRPLDAWEETELQRRAPNGIVVETKIDLPRRIESVIDSIPTSSHTGQGLARLEKSIISRLATNAGSESGVVVETSARCHDSLMRTEESLNQALELIATQAGDELVANELRLSLDELGRIVGAVYTDDILDRVFSRFCIGK